MIRTMAACTLLAFIYACSGNTPAEEKVGKDCNKFRTGVFEMYIDTHRIIVERNETRQLEKTSFGLANYEVSRLDDCNFELQLIETTFPQFKEKIGAKYHVEITSTKGKSYTCSMYEIGVGDIQYSTLEKVK